MMLYWKKEHFLQNTTVQVSNVGALSLLSTKYDLHTRDHLIKDQLQATTSDFLLVLG